MILKIRGVEGSSEKHGEKPDRKGRDTMKHFYVFILRASLSAAFAVVLSRMFLPDRGLVSIAALGLFMFAAAYLAEYLRKRKSK